MTEREMLSFALKGDGNAIALCEALGRLSQVWDDLIDQDTKPTPERITEAFYAALIEIPMNPFYQAFQVRLLPQLQSVIFDWLTANKLEKTEAGARVAFTLRDSLAGFVVVCASLIGGREWAIEAAETVRLYTHDEDFDGYMKERGYG